MQNWRKLGQIYCPSEVSWWMLSHASNPVPYDLGNGLVRVFFSSRAKENKAYISYVDLKISPEKVELIKVCDAAVLEIGERGAFDDRGLSMGCLLKVENKLHLYYLGWNLAKDVPFRNAIGLAVEQKDGQFKRFSNGPVLDRSIFDPYSISYPFIIEDEGIYKMWYGTHSQWGKTTNDMIHHITYASSEDGLQWKPSGQVCIATTNEHYAFSKPCVIKEDGIYKMWYSYRGGKYQIGYAESLNGLDWERKDHEVGLFTSKDAWDAEMLCYPYVFDFEGSRYLFYNGNGYGKTGFGLALLEQ